MEYKVTYCVGSLRSCVTESSQYEWALLSPFLFEWLVACPRAWPSSIYSVY